jgi:acyl-ACP thioesterase
MSILYTEERRINYYDLDCRGKLKISAFLRMIHIAADINATGLGIGFNDLNPLSISFVLQRFGVSIQRMPEYDELITLRTWPANIERGIFIRKGEMLSGNGKKIMEWTSIWVLFDVRERRILRPGALPVTISGMGDMGVETEAKKIVLPSNNNNEISSYLHTVRYSEVDTNMHMNNSIYGDLIGNVFNEDWIEMQINFLAEAKLGDEIEVVCKKEGESFLIIGKNNDKAAFSALITTK